MCLNLGTKNGSRGQGVIRPTAMNRKLADSLPESAFLLVTCPTSTKQGSEAEALAKAAMVGRENSRLHRLINLELRWGLVCRSESKQVRRALFHSSSREGWGSIAGEELFVFMNYAKYLRTDHWIELRGAKLLEANGRCQKCRSKHKLQVHHLTYERKWKERLTDLMVLCERCHEKEHNLFPVYVDDWKPKASKPVGKKEGKGHVLRERETHPLFKYVKPLRDGIIRSTHYRITA